MRSFLVSSWQAMSDRDNWDNEIFEIDAEKEARRRKQQEKIRRNREDRDSRRLRESKRSRRRRKRGDFDDDYEDGNWNATSARSPRNNQRRELYSD